MSTAAAIGRRQPAGVPFVAALIGGMLLIGVGAAQQTLLTLAAVVLIGGIAAAMAWPELAALAVVFLIWSNIPAVAVTTHGAPLVLGALVPFLLLIPLISQLRAGERLLVTRSFLVLLVFFATMIVSTLLSPNQHEAVEQIKTFLIEGVITYFLVINVVRTPASLKRAIWAMLAAGAFLGLVTVFQWATGGYTRTFSGFSKVDPSYYLGHSEVPRISGPIGDPNYYAQIMLVLVPLGLLMLWRERSPMLRLIAGTCTGLICMAIMLTYSRGAGLGFLAVFVAMACFRYLRAVHVLVVILGVGALLVAVPEYGGRITSISVSGATSSGTSADGGADESTRSRTTEMLAAAHVLADHPVAGVGPDGFPLFYQEYAQRIGGEVRETTHMGAKKGQEAQRQAHNMFLGLAADLGLPGLIAFLSLVGVTMARLLRTRRHWLRRGDPERANLATGFLLALLSYLATGVFLSLAFERYFWLLLALAGAAGSVALRDRAHEARAVRS
jgi:putative inorganic carbon (hco3(-)) transporter